MANAPSTAKAAPAAKKASAPSAKPAAEPTAAAEASGPLDGLDTCACGGGCPRCSPGNDLAAALGSGATPLPAASQSWAEQAFGTSFADVRVHAGGAATAFAEASGARAFAFGRDIGFDAQGFDPAAPEDRGVLAHELAHVVQFGRSGSTGATPGLEQEAARAGAAATAGAAVGAITGVASPGSGPLFAPKKDDHDELPANPFAGWKPDANSVLLIYGDDRLFVLPGSKSIFFADAKTQALFEKSDAHYTQDLGTLFSVPSTGASGTRIFQAGTSSALVLDAGYDPSPGQTTVAAAVYVPQVMAIAASMGIRKISRIQPIHGHSDHVTGIPLLVANLNVTPENVVIPKEFESLGPVQRVEQALRTPAMAARGFGPTWNPQRPPKDKGGPGDVYRGSFMVGELVVELVALRSALGNMTSKTADLGSYLTKVTRRTDGAKVVILGDFRGADLETIRTAMEAQTAGSWNEFFRGVSTISGFSHHVGRMEPDDVRGMMSLLDATLLQGGKLRVVEQTNRNISTQGRNDTLELAARLGIEVTYTDMPTATQAPSSVSASKNTTTATGPTAVAQPIIASNLTQGVQRLQRLLDARLTLEQWRPWLEELNGADRMKNLLTEFDTSIGQLRQSLRTAMEAATNVRAERLPASSGPRDYTGGTLGTAYVNATNAIPAQVPAEQVLTPQAESDLAALRNQNLEEIPRKVAVYRAVTYGEYSDQAFTYMMSQLDPMTRNELIGRKPGTTGALVPRHVAFSRVRAQFNFQQSVLGSGETISVAHLPPGAQVRARVVGGAMLGLELWNDIGAPLWEAHKISEQINVSQNVAPFVRRLAFWQQVGVQPKFVGIVDPTFGSPRRVEDQEDAIKKLKGGDLDALIIEEPGLSDADVLQLAAWLVYHVRNYDEYASLFVDSNQDALRWQTKGFWPDAEWSVRVGYYETSGSNHVEEKWYPHPKLTEFMRHYVPWLIANTRALLDQAGRGGTEPPGFTASLGTLSPGSTSATNPALTRMRLKDPAAVPIVRVPWTGDMSPVWAGAGSTEKSGDLAELHVSSRPEFYVLETAGDEVRVMGADFNTYTAIRDLPTRTRSIGTAGSHLNHEYFAPDHNEKGYVWIDAYHLEPIPTGNANAPAAPPPVTPTPVVPLPTLDVTQQGGAGRGPGPWRDTGNGNNSLIGPKVFQPLPGPQGNQGDVTVLPGIGGHF